MGNLYFDDRCMNDIHPKDRNIAMVFQNYALYPHMNVAENIGFGLKMKKIPKDDIDKKVQATAELIGLTEYLDRFPKELSGGQRQRVALGRAISRNPEVFLMDEPLSNLDAKLRVQTRAQISRIAKKLGNTTIYVTHDQVEAMTMADRIVLMRDGFVQQVATPRNIYLNPENVFVAGFMGSPAMNFIKLKVLKEGLMGGDKIIKIPDEIISRLFELGYGDKDIILGIRPENILLLREDEKSDYYIEIEIELSELLGSETLLHFKLINTDMVSKINIFEEFRAGEKKRIVFDFDFIHFFDPDSEKSIDIDYDKIATGEGM